MTTCKYISLKLIIGVFALAALTGCATLSPDADLAAIQQLTLGKTAGVSVTLH